MRSLLFDIDRTIFDTAKMADAINMVHALILKVGLDKVECAEKDYIKSLTNDNIFRTEDFTKFLSQRFSFDNPGILAGVLYDKKYNHIYDEIVFPEFFTAVEKLKHNYRFGIYSEGDLKFQNHKFKSMGIREYFDPNLIFIVPAKDTSDVVSKLPKGSIIVDDKERICEFLTDNGIKAIWLNKKDDRKSERFTTIHNLLDLPNIL